MFLQGVLRNRRAPHFSLKTRLSIAVVLLVLVVTAGMTSSALYLVKTSLKASIAQEQFGRISATADAIDEKFANRRILLQTFARSLELQDLHDAKAIPYLLSRQTALEQSFSNVAVLDKHGEVVGNYIGPWLAGTINVQDRSYFQDTVRKRSGLISQPISNRKNGQPQVVMTEPVLGPRGEVRYVVVGQINLREPHFLGELAGMKFGHSGYMFIVNTDGVVVDHPDKSRIMLPEGHGADPNPAIASAINGFEGTTEALNRYGVYGLYTFKRIRQTNWIVGSIYPADEAFAPVEQVSREAWLGACVLALVAGALSLVVLQRNLAPLSQLSRHMRAMRVATHYQHSSLRFADDEIGHLGSAFETLMREHQITQDRLADSEKSLRAITDNLPVLISYVDASGCLRFMNATFRDWFGVDTVGLLNHSAEQLLDPRQYSWNPQYLQQALQGQRVAFDSESTTQGMTRNLSTVYVPDRKQDGVVAGVFVLSTDVTALKLVERSLDQLAHRDGLTGLPNRLQFDECLAATLLRSQRSHLPMALIFLDIDFFKAINDGRGHAAGDAVLQVFASRLSANVRATDFVARLAGDEFVIVMEALFAPTDAVHLAQKLLAAIRQPMDIEGELTRISSSMGIAYCEHCDELPAHLLARADRALYRAKLAGRDTYALDGDADAAGAPAEA